MTGRLRSERGFTLIELLASLLVLTTGIVALLGTFDVSRDSTSESELRTAAIDRAQREIDRIRALQYDQIAHPTGGILSAAAEPDDPTSRITGATNFRWNPSDASAVEPIVTAADGVVAMKQVIGKGAEDRFGFTVWRFVTWTDEPACVSAVTCPDAGDEYKRVTVVVMPNGLGDQLKPVWTSTTVIDPSAAASSDDEDPVTLCLNEAGTDLEQCTKEITGEPVHFYLTNTRADTGDVRQPIPGEDEAGVLARKLHTTVAPTGACTAGDASGCPVPDLLADTELPAIVAPEVVPPLLSFATDVAGDFAGRPLKRDVACDGVPSASDNLEGGLWVSPAFATATTFNGKGGITLYTHSWTETPQAVTLCIAVYKTPTSISNLISNPATQLGDRVAYAYTWPADSTLFQIPFDLGATPTIAVGERVAVRIWVAAASADDIVIQYDHPNKQSALTLHKEAP